MHNGPRGAHPTTDTQVGLNNLHNLKAAVLHETTPLEKMSTTSSGTWWKYFTDVYVLNGRKTNRKKTQKISDVRSCALDQKKTQFLFSCPRQMQIEDNTMLLLQICQHPSIHPSILSFAVINQIFSFILK